MLVDFNANLPRLIPAQGTNVYQFPGCSHFLNLPNGKCFYCSGGSSENPVEANVAVSLTLFLCAMLNVCEDDVMILSGYTRQVRNVGRRARSKGLYTIRVKTVNVSQADDAPFVILSTEQTDGNQLGFMQASAKTIVATSRQKTALYIVWNFESGHSWAL